MAKKKKVKKSTQSFDTPEKAIKERARNLPIHECLISRNWHKLKMAEIVISRKHTNGNITYGVYLIDLYSTGLRDTFYSFNINQKSYDDMLYKMGEKINLVPCSYTLAHNIIYGGVEYAEQFGFEPEKSFAVTEYILKEDNDEIKFLDIRFGYKGKPTILVFKDNYPEEDINTLKANAGEGNYSIMNIEHDSMHSDPENAMFEVTNISLEDFLTKSTKDNFNESFFIDYVSDAFNKKLIDNEGLRQKNELTRYVNDLIGFPVDKEEGLVRIENQDIQNKYFEFYDTVDNQKSRKIKKIIPEIEQFYDSNQNVPELAALLLKCYLDIKDTTKFENFLPESLKKYPTDFSTRAIAVDYYLGNNKIDAIPELFNNCFTINKFTEEKKPVNLTETKLFHLAYFYHFLERQNIVQAEQYLKVLSMYQNDEKTIKLYLLKLTLAKLFFIDKGEVVKANLPKDLLDLL